MGIRNLSTASISTGTKRSKFWDQSSALPGDFESIQTITVGAGGTGSVTFSSIPQGYTHLQIRAIAKDTAQSSGAFNLRGQFNGDTAGNYSTARIYSNGSGVGQDAQQSQSTMVIGAIAANGYANVWGGTVVDIFDYSNTSKCTTTRSINGQAVNTTPTYVFMNAGLWTNTAAVTSMTITCDASAIAEGSSFALYGVK